MSYADDSMAEPPLDESLLHVAATRPAMVKGIPWTVIVPVFVACLEIEMAFGLQMALILDIPLIVFGVVVGKHDYNAPRVWLVWLRTKAMIVDDWYYGGTSVSPMPLKIRRLVKRQSRGVPSNAW